MKYTKFRAKSICDRCGVTKAEARIEPNEGCFAWGKTYGRHQWNEEPVEINEIVVSLKKLT